MDISPALLKESVKNLQCSHLEADTDMLFIYSRIRAVDKTRPVLIDSEDANVVVLCAYTASIIDGDLSIKRKKANIDCKQLCSNEMTKSIVPLHVVTGCDVISSLFGIGKKKTAWKRVQSSVEARELLLNLSEENLTKFIIKYIYDDKLCKKWRKMKTKKAKSLARVGPDDDSNIQRNKRVKYHTNVFLHFQDPSPPPTNHGYTVTNGLCLPMMYTKSPMPDEIARITSQNVIDSEANDSDSDESIASSDEDIDDGLDKTSMNLWTWSKL